MSHHFQQPPLARKTDGSERCVGVEIEYAGIGFEDSVALVQQVFGGEIDTVDAYRSSISGTSLGDFKIELDTTYAHAEEGESLQARATTEIAKRIGDVAKFVVPFEIVSPPVPISRLEELDSLIDALKAAGAAGTNVRLHYAFAVQLNPELASLEVGFVLRQFQAFLLLEDELRQLASQSSIRRLVGFAEPFPPGYKHKVLKPAYSPDWGAFIDDYIDENPTRNRSLDLLPLMVYVDEPRVSCRLHDERINGRPAFHYRLPDSRVDEKGWSLSRVWNRWVEVERLAHDDVRFAEQRQSYLNNVQ